MASGDKNCLKFNETERRSTLLTRTIPALYGTDNACTLFIAENDNGAKWYAVKDSVNVNVTYDEIPEGVNIETLTDVDHFDSRILINSEEDLIAAIS